MDPILIGVGGLRSGAISFYSQNVYQPEHLPRTLIAAAGLEKVVRTTHSLHSKGCSRSRIPRRRAPRFLAGYYNVWGIKIAPKEEDDSAFAANVKNQITAGNYAEYSPFTLHSSLHGSFLD